MRWLSASIAIVVLVALGAFFWPAIHRTIVAPHVAEAPAPAPASVAQNPPPAPPPASGLQTSPSAPAAQSAPAAPVGQTSPSSTPPAPVGETPAPAPAAQSAPAAPVGQTSPSSTPPALARTDALSSAGARFRSRIRRVGACSRSCADACASARRRDARLQRQSRNRTRVSQTRIRHQGPCLGAQ